LGPERPVGYAGALVSSRVGCCAPWSRKVLVALTALLSSGCPLEEREPLVGSGSLASATNPAMAPERKAPLPCLPLDPATLAPFATCGTSVVKGPVPEIVDETAILRPLYERLAGVERGRATRAVRIAIYGDSNLTSDFLSAHLRRVLQARYGDAGHGWISLSRPWGSYRHEDVLMAGYWPMFKLYAPTTHVAGA
jgi:hypothetical protein